MESFSQTQLNNKESESYIIYFYLNLIHFFQNVQTEI